MKVWLQTAISTHKLDRADEVPTRPKQGATQHYFYHMISVGSPIGDHRFGFITELVRPLLSLTNASNATLPLDKRIFMLLLQ